MKPHRAWVMAGVVIGVADLADALLFFGPRGVSPIRILQETLRRRWPLWGPVYGVFVYATMNAVVIPLSAAAGGVPPLPVLINGLVIHVVGVGLPAAWFASRMVPTRA